MEIEQIKDLMDHFEASGIYKMEILLGEDKLVMQKQPPVMHRQRRTVPLNQLKQLKIMHLKRKAQRQRQVKRLVRRKRKPNRLGKI